MVSEYRAVWKVSWFTVTLIMSVAKLAEAQNYSYCINGGVNRITNFKGDISSNMEGQAYYQSGMDCTWVLDAGEGGRVLVTVLSSSLQWTPNDATCTQYDHMEVRNGDTASGDVIVTWCGDRSPSTFISTGRYLYIKFKTKSQNNTGVRLKYETFDATLCPPGWREYSNHCYKVETHPLSWEDAHRYCVRDQSNLVSISSEAEQSFITGEFPNLIT
ncbi:bone morphogenetic protein 1-like [Lingula anatina]|uniref:Bone morphogenetic protein 1-like n=1 Tax=Lingula anatina TaxID=7574 RepID=A0A1S3J5Z7_LINAN|nr:bone morphogenetic protein 1-like [Lingula anatina]|eukprot:XP_013405264.1 bone morphogenetic protein 1-like [Lingula anatina]